MKILTVRFKNLNSLAGEWLIDFTDPHFTSSGIFAIVGATGAGKSTILDAISLALYGRTPRLKQISKSSNEIMSRQTGECYSEVAFISSKGSFRAHWSQRRARKSAAGELQAPRHEFVSAKTDKVIASKLKDVAEKVSEATGMNFDQFTRSMLLAQGDFSKFLQASSDQRAPILEQITGTEIYSLISKQVHLQTSTQEKKLERLRQELDSLQILSPEEIQGLHNEKSAILTRTSQLKETINLTNTGINWYQNILSLSEKKKNLKEQSVHLQLQWENTAPLREQLEKATKSHLLQGIYSHLSQLRSSQKEELLRITTTTTGLQEQKKIQTTLQQQMTECEQAYRQIQKLQQDTAKIIKEVHQLDYDAQKSFEEIEQSSKKVVTLEHQLTLQNSALKNQEQKKADCLKKIATVRQYQQKHGADEQLVEILSGLEERSTQLLQLLAAIPGAIKRKNNLENDLRTKKELQLKEDRISIELHQKEEKLNTLLSEGRQQFQLIAPNGLSSMYKEIQNLNKELNRLREISTLLDEKNLLIAKVEKEKIKETGLDKQLEELRKTLQQTKSLLQLQKNIVAKQEEIVLLANKIESFEQEREKLKENTPCPLCGSTIHPFIESTVYHRDDLTKQLHEEQQKLEELREKERREDLALNGLLLSRKTSSNAIQEAAEKIELIAQKTQQSGLASTVLNDMRPALLALQEKVTAAEHTIDKVEAENKKLMCWEQELKKHTTALAEQKEKVQQLQRDTEKCETTLQLHTDGLAVSQNEISALTAELSQLTAPYSTTPLSSREEIQQVQADLKEKQQRWKNSMASLRDEETLLQTLTSTHKETLFSIEAQKEERTKTTEHIDLLKIQHQTTLKKRTALFADKDPLIVEATLQKQVLIAEKKLTLCRQQLMEKEKEIATLLERKEQLSLSTTRRKESLDTKEQEFASLLLQHSFDSETAFLNSRLPDEKREQLFNQVERLQLQLRETQSKLTSVEEAISEEKLKQPTDLSHETLVSRLAEQTEQLGEFQQQLGALTEQISNYEKNIANQKEKQELFTKQQKEYGYWAQLHHLVGSADGKKFRNFAQGLTFELMVHHANLTLEKMSDRYLLRRTPEQPLELTVIDAYQAGEVRSTANLSGGETFIISLALALGLSAMASKKVQIDSLFLDEGFGTLDEESLEVALETLSTLQQTGKIIGIISHVPLLKERIDIQIHLHAGLDGRSTISGPGISRFKVS
jgi:exonuclease SbcC